MVYYSSISLVFALLLILAYCLIWLYRLLYLISSLQTALGIAIRDKDTLTDRSDVNEWAWHLLKELLARRVRQLFKYVLLAKHLVFLLSIASAALSTSSLFCLIYYSIAIIINWIYITSFFFTIFLFQTIYRACNFSTRQGFILLQDSLWDD